MTAMRHFLAILLVIGLLIIPSTTSAQSEVRCNPIQGSEICIQDVSLSKGTVENGESLTLNIDLVNVGNQTGDAMIIMGTHQPEGHYTYALLKEVHNLDSGEQKRLSLTLPVENDGQTGVHELNFMVFDNGQTHLYDATGFSRTLVIGESSINLLQWLKGLHYTIQIGLVVVPILLTLIGWLWSG